MRPPTADRAPSTTKGSDITQDGSCGWSPDVSPVFLASTQRCSPRNTRRYARPR